MLAKELRVRQLNENTHKAGLFGFGGSRRRAGRGARNQRRMEMGEENVRGEHFFPPHTAGNQSAFYPVNI